LAVREVSSSLAYVPPTDWVQQDRSEITYETNLDEVDDIPTLRVGQRVRHPKFGEGTVHYCEGKREKQRIIVFFPSVGAKTLSLQFARLEIIHEP
jgi:hypothetical protein